MKYSISARPPHEPHCPGNARRCPKALTEGTVTRKATQTPKLPKKLSPGEEAFTLHCRAEFHPVNQPKREYQFFEDRKWKFDFAWPDDMLAVEIEGGTWIAGRHNRGSSIEKDFAKYNTAAKLGWRVLRYSTQMVLAGDAIADVLEMLAGGCADE